MDAPQIIQIHDYNVSFYGGKLEKKFKAVIGLMNASYGMIGWIKFYEKEEDILPDEFDNLGLMNMHMSLSQFDAVISSLRSGRTIKLIYVKELKNAMLTELPAEMPPDKLKNIGISIN